LVARLSSQAEHALGARLGTHAERGRLRQTADLRCAVRTALRRVQRAFRAEYDATFEPRFEYQRSTESIRVNVFTQVMQNLLCLQSAIDALYGHAADLLPGEAAGRLPIRGHRDLLLLFIALYYGADKERNFWRVDEVVAHCFIPMWRRWVQALMRSLMTDT
jgi:hypothetical protein